jgi:hypothetical protein
MRRCFDIDLNLESQLLSELEVLATSAATTLVGLMATDGWKEARSLLSVVWRRARPDQLEEVEADLNSANQIVIAARERDNIAVEQVVRDEWCARIGGLLATKPEAHRDLREALHRMHSLTPQASSTSVSMHADVRDQGRSYQSAGDMVIHE